MTIKEKKKMRLFVLSIATLAFLAGSVASAFEIGIVGDTTISVLPGQEFTVEFSLDNANAAPVAGFDISLTGLNGATVVSGVAAEGNLYAACIPGAGCFTPVQSTQNAFYDYADLSGLGNDAAAGSVVVFRGIAGTSAVMNTGDSDPGLAGVIGTYDPVDARLTIAASASGVYSLAGTYSDGVDAIAVDGGTLTVNVIPEPGTALLMGLGLAGLAAAGRRD